MAYYASSNVVFERIEGFTLQLEQTPLEEFRTSAEARAVFIKNLNAMANDMQWLVHEIRISQDNLEEIKCLKLSADKYNPSNETFIAKATAALTRFATCFPAIKDIVLDGTHEEIDELELASFYMMWVEDVEDALKADLTPRTWEVNR
jgi:hypothetical protein